MMRRKETSRSRLEIYIFFLLLFLLFTTELITSGAPRWIMEVGKKSQRVYMAVVVAGRGWGWGGLCSNSASQKVHTVRQRQAQPMAAAVAAATAAAAAHWHCRPDTPQQWVRQRHTHIHVHIDTYTHQYQSTEKQSVRQVASREPRAANSEQGLKRHKSCTNQGTQPSCERAVTATARHVYGQNAYAAAVAAAATSTATPAARQAASQPGNDNSALPDADINPSHSGTRTLGM